MDYVTVRIWVETRRLLRLIAAQSGEQMVQAMHRLCQDEWDRIQLVNGAASVAQPGASGEIGQQNAE